MGVVNAKERFVRERFDLPPAPEEFEETEIGAGEALPGETPIEGEETEGLDSLTDELNGFANRNTKQKGKSFISKLFGGK
jgi:hypothetical protein